MKKAHRYILEPYKGMNTRYRCPSCQQSKTFSRYIDTETGEHIHPTVGRCNRENNCGYHYTPKQYFQDNNISFDTPQLKAYKPRPVIPQQKPISFISFEFFKQSLQIDKTVLQVAETNHFVKFLINLFGVEVANELVSRYFIGTSKHWNGATVFWQIDTQGKIRTGKIMLYSPTTGKRVKEPFNHIYWAHKALKQPEFELRQCFFGEHLLIDKTKPVAIVESEKTAVIASVYLPQFIWLAAGSKDGLNAEKCSILKGRTVILFPDLNGFEKWSNKAKELSPLAIFTVSDLLERKATEAEREQGLDLADYLIKYEHKSFALPEPEPTEPLPAVQLLVEVKPFEQPDPEKATKVTNQQNILSSHAEPLSQVVVKEQPQNWSNDIAELENYFASIELPTQPIKLNSFSTITDCSLFIESHFATVKANNGKQAFLPYLNRLQQLKAMF
jgi:rubredoxin